MPKTLKNVTTMTVETLLHANLIFSRMTNRWDFLPPPPINVTLIKGQCHFAVARNFVKFVLYDKQAKEFANWISRNKHPDETYFGTIQHNPQLGAPGAYTG